MFEKIVIVTRKTRLQELIERFNTRAQAKFYVEHAGGNFAEYEAEDQAYRGSLETLRRACEVGLKVQLLERALVPTYLFVRTDLVVTLGQDGLVANTAKYVCEQPIVAFNPDPTRFDGVLLPFLPAAARPVLESVLSGRFASRKVTLAEARLNDGQRILAFNDLFIGARTHVSARYRLLWNGRQEVHSSSGVLVSTGAGSTGWLSSLFNMLSGVASFTDGRPGHPIQLAWEDERLVFVVREPFVSRHSSAQIVMGMLEPGKSLVLESEMPWCGAIFSDGIEADFLEFNSGATATICPAEEKAHLVTTLS